MSVLIGGVLYQTVKVGRGRRAHLNRGAGAASTYCGLSLRGRWHLVDHLSEDELLCNNCDAYARASREGRTL